MFAWLKHRKPETARARIGRLGEAEAERSLKAKGFRVLARNWRAGKDEIDLVCEDEGVLVFVETRTRRSEALAGGYDSIDRRKKEALLRVCGAYLASLNAPPRAFRFDVVEVEHLDGEAQATRHFENVPLFSKSKGRGA